MHEMASKRLQRQIADGRVTLFVGEAKAIPLPDNSVDKLYHLNVCYFFDPLDVTLREIGRVLKPGGSLSVLSFLVTYTSLVRSAHS